MRKSLVALSLLASFSLATQIDFESVSIKNEKVLYEQGIEYFKAKDYKNAYNVFDTLFINNLDNILVNYYLGRSAFELKKYEIAISAYDRILILKPNNHRVRVELGQTYLAMGLWAQALEEFTKVSKGELPKQVEQRVQKTIALLKSKQQKSLFSTYALFAMMYDSNINNLSKSDTFDIYSPVFNGNVTFQSNEKKQSAMIYQAVASFNYKYKVEDDVIWDSNFSTVNLKYVNHKEKDLNVLSFNTGPMYYTKDYKLALSFMIDRVFLAHEMYQLNYYIKPEYTSSFSDNTMYIGALKFGRTNYKELDALDAKILELSNNLRYLTKDYGMFTFDVNLGRENEVNEVRSDVSNTYYSLGLTNNYNLAQEYTLISNITYKHTKFSDFDEGFQSKREDKKRDYSLGIEKQLNKKTVINLGTTYTQRDSNHPTAEYDKYIAKLSLYMNF